MQKERNKFNTKSTTGGIHLTPENIQLNDFRVRKSQSHFHEADVYMTLNGFEIDNRALTITTFKHLKWYSLILISTFILIALCMTRKIILSVQAHYLFSFDLFYLSKFLKPVIYLFFRIIFTCMIRWKWKNTSLFLFLWTKALF